ncbi:MAG TPA: hypothetical protein VK203_19670 [Nostocaceae cyanobacterium]|nr:hypothetical protein [Nostocaceae cyanobacterium]
MELDLQNYPVQPKPCEGCPFAGKNPVQISSSYYCELLNNLLGDETGIGQHLCHSVDNKAICRGGRDIQLRWMCATGVLSEPTDEAFNNFTQTLQES